MNIDDLTKSLQNLSDDELREKMNQIRAARRQRIEAPKKAATKLPAATKTPKVTEQDLLDLDEII